MSQIRYQVTGTCVTCRASLKNVRRPDRSHSISIRKLCQRCGHGAISRSGPRCCRQSKLPNQRRDTRRIRSRVERDQDITRSAAGNRRECSSGLKDVVTTQCDIVSS